MKEGSAGGSTVVLVAGYRFAGKSLVLQHLEQAGYACVDNLPPRLVRDYLAHRRGRGGEPARRAVGLDVADAEEAAAVPLLREELAAEGCRSAIVFLEASESALRERESAVAAPDGGAAARRDSAREALAAIRAAADLILDSSYASPTDERDRIVALAEGEPRRIRTVVEISSFGFKHGAPAGDLVVDVRFIPNPFYVAALRPLTGKDKACADYVFSNESARVALEGLVRLAEAMEPAYSAQCRPALRIRIGCTGGRHRSVAMVEALGAALAERGMETRLGHRDLPSQPA